MSMISAGPRTGSTESAAVPARSLRRGLVIENLDAVPDMPIVLFTICSVTQLAGPVAPTAGRLGA
ncbi:hypothetical protein [Streptomyces sp. NPDC088762]|uniref:hypothetical protein n=1 Tax=Streptomyces sp. NPDC088762 TaxID=3365891 RepID=UPI0037FB092D